MSIPYLTDYREHFGKKVYVYYNLTKKCWSVRHKGKVLFHAHDLSLANVEFKVNENGRQRVVREKKKYVHAGAQGVLVEAGLQRGLTYKPVTYNPYNAGHFITRDDRLPIFNSVSATLCGKSLLAVG